MSTEVNAVNCNQQPSMLTRVAVTYGGLGVPAFILGNELGGGATFKEACNELGNTYKAVHDANKKDFKENIHKTSENIDKMGNWKYLFGLIPSAIQMVDKMINE